MAKKEPKSGPVTVAMLLDFPVDGVAYRGGSLVQLDAAVAAQLIDNGCADDSDAAVAYLQEQGVAVAVHQAPQPEA